MARVAVLSRAGNFPDVTLDTFGAQSRLDVGDRSYQAYRLDAVVDDPQRTAVQLADPPREPLASRGRSERDRRRHPRARRSQPRRRRGRQPRAAVHARPRPDAGLHRRARDRRPRGDARRDGRSRRRSACRRARHPRRPRDRPLDHRRRRGRARRVHTQRRSSSSSATASATRSCGGRSRRSRRCACSRPNRGICHQVNLEYLAQVVFRGDDGLVYPDTLVGTDSHTPMVNGLGVLGWGVGGIEAEAAMLGQSLSMLLPRVVGIELVGALPAGSTATDLVLTVAELLRRHGVVGKFVEFYGDGVGRVPLENRATIGNMSPEYGSTCTIFPIDDETLRYLRATGRPDDLVALVETYAKEQGLWHDPGGAARCTTRRSCSTSRRSSRRSRGPPGRRTGSRCPMPAPSSDRRCSRSARRTATSRSVSRPAAPTTHRSSRSRPAIHPRPHRTPKNASNRPSGQRKPSSIVKRRACGVELADGRAIRSRRRACGDRGDHVVHEHVEPVGDDRRRPVGARTRSRAA